MRKVKQLRKWGIYELNQREQSKYGFKFAVIHPDNMGAPDLTPSDSDWECDSMEQAESWIQNYD